jgi:hypothetical protein
VEKPPYCCGDIGGLRRKEEGRMMEEGGTRARKEFRI